MLQWKKCNEKTGREIRGVEANHIQKQFMKERNGLQEERKELEHETKALHNSMTDHTSQMLLEETWQMTCQLQIKICTGLIKIGISEPLSNIQKTLYEACAPDHYGNMGIAFV